MQMSNNLLKKATPTNIKWSTEEEEEGFDPWGWEPNYGDKDFGVSDRDFY
ncbi:hypothetical protein M23134_05771 [Microscilla marina ATCC 23134]|uniref:Uncharacterized protein n=1 Tax=Microscilla marina ATCC 23134 TaxID=313606 RepID=A1ZIN0_MICM2|nr:hypothetical protein M23134_05771 [Microscilla marina ATCC 23134]